MEIDLTEPVSLTFSLKYLTNFCKASGLSETVKLCLSSEVPLLVEYGLTSNSYLRFYLAPKVRQCLVFLIVPSNARRLGTKSDRMKTLLITSNMSKIACGATCGAMSLVSSFRAEELARNATSAQKDCTSPTYAFTSLRGTSDKGTNQFTLTLHRTLLIFHHDLPLS